MSKNIFIISYVCILLYYNMLYVIVDTLISLSNRIKIFNKQGACSKAIVVKVKFV